MRKPIKTRLIVNGVRQTVHLILPTKGKGMVRGLDAFAGKLVRVPGKDSRGHLTTQLVKITDPRALERIRDFVDKRRILSRKPKH